MGQEQPNPYALAIEELEMSAAILRNNLAVKDLIGGEAQQALQAASAQFGQSMGQVGRGALLGVEWGGDAWWPR